MIFVILFFSAAQYSLTGPALFDHLAFLSSLFVYSAVMSISSVGVASSRFCRPWPVCVDSFLLRALARCASIATVPTCASLCLNYSTFFYINIINLRSLNFFTNHNFSLSSRNLMITFLFAVFNLLTLLGVLD